MGVWNKSGESGHTQTEEARRKISLTLSGRKKTDEHQAKITKALKGRKMPDDFGAKISRALSGKKLPEKTLIKLRGKHWSPKTEFKKGQVSLNKGKKASRETRLKQRFARLGRFTKEKNPSWKGGITPENRLLRNSSEYNWWRRDVFERDSFTCLNCGDRGCHLNAHHFEPFSECKDKRLLIDNGVTLCRECHKKLHSN